MVMREIPPGPLVQFARKVAEFLAVMSCVPSLDPVSTIVQQSMMGRTLSMHRQITGASFLTIMFKQTVWPEAFIGRSLCLKGRAFKLR